MSSLRKGPTTPEPKHIQIKSRFLASQTHFCTFGPDVVFESPESRTSILSRIRSILVLKSNFLTKITHNYSCALDGLHFQVRTYNNSFEGEGGCKATGADWRV